ncbi:MAG: hypothetical protein FWH12_03320 [Treponema sp.]|nr:hypothetical protein [Treponema sp.]
MYTAALYLPLLFSAGALLIVCISLLYIKSYLKKRTSQERILSELKEDIDQIIKTIDSTTERDITLIEERSLALRKLLEETDRRINLYIREMETRKEAEAAYEDLKNRQIEKEKSPNPLQSYYELGQKRRPQIKEEEGPEESPYPIPDFTLLSAAEAPSASEPPPSPPVGEQIRELLRGGFSPGLIASRLGISIAEVELSAALLERREAR